MDLAPFGCRGGCCEELLVMPHTLCCIFPTAFSQQDLGSSLFLEDFWEMSVSCNLLLGWGMSNNWLVQ